MFMSRVLHQRWMAFLLVWILLAIPAVGAVVLLVKPTYTATGFIMADLGDTIPPCPPAPEATIAALLGNVVQEVQSDSVLNAARADPSLTNNPDVGSVDDLREAMTVSAVPRTYLVRVSVTKHDPQTAVQVAQAVLQAYERHATAPDAERLRRMRAALEQERKRLGDEQERCRKELSSLSQKYATTRVAMTNPSLAKSGMGDDKEQSRIKSDAQSILEMMKLQERLESLTRDYTLVEKSITRLDVESRRPNRIRADDAEMPPNGIIDSRPVFGCLAVAGTFVLALGGVALAGVRKDETADPPARDATAAEYRALWIGGGGRGAGFTPSLHTAAIRDVRKWESAKVRR